MATETWPRLKPQEPFLAWKKKKENKKPHTCGSGVKHTANKNNKTVLFPIIFYLGHILLIKVRLKVFCVTESLHIQLHVYDQKAECENATVVISSRRRLEFWSGTWWIRLCHCWLDLPRLGSIFPGYNS